MASDKFGNEFGYQQRESSRLFVRSIDFSMQLHNYKRSLRMAQIKWAWIICDMLGIPVTVLGILANIDNVRSTILFMIALSYALPRCYFDIIARRQRTREKEIELWHKEQDKIDRINKNK